MLLTLRRVFRLLLNLYIGMCLHGAGGGSGGGGRLGGCGLGGGGGSL